MKANVSEATVKAHIGKVFNIAYRFCGNYSDAQDLTQEVFVKLIVACKKNNYNIEGPIDSLLYKMIRNRYIDFIRKSPKIRVVSLDSPVWDTIPLSETITDGAGQPENLLEKKENGKNIQDALNKLKPQYRMVLVLSDIENISCGQISKIMDCSINKVWIDLHRARKILRKLLEANL
ncbi:MAG: RNA polymerase sigma factor [Elusimicrobia bacterium]|nr:RNA polymerase sigma factor [Elusimicrobiota bacterium]MBU2615015.1 RNA polymerase sigma factor [Elusimicrobiota bacterium]